MNKYKILFFVFLLMFLGMTVYEFIKEYFLPSLTAWESHSITIVFSSSITVIIGYFILLKIEKLIALRDELRDKSKELLRKTHTELEEKFKERTRELDFQKTTLDEHAIVSVTDIQGNITYVNEKFCEISGYSRKELIGNNHRIVKSGVHEQALYKDLWLTISSGKPWHGELKNKKKNGEYYWVTVTIVPFINERGKPFQYVAIRTDITDKKIIEQNLRDSQQMMSEMLKNTQEGFWYIDNDCNTVKVNSAMCEMIGRSESDIIGKSIFDFVDEENTEIFHQQMALRKTGGKGAYEISLMQPDGTNVPCISNPTPIFNEDGEKIGAVAMWMDISARIESEQILKENVERFQQLSDVSSDWVWEMDENLRFTYTSDSIKHLYGFDPATSYGGRREDFLNKEDRERPEWQAHLADLRARRPFRVFKYKFVAPNKKTFFVQISGAPIIDSDGNFKGYRGTGTDITEFSKTQMELEKARETADRANLAKSEFLSSMSHELRTPLNAILGFGQMLEYNSSEPLSKGQQKCVTHIIGGGKHLLELINDVLDLAKIESGTISASIEKINLSNVIQDCAAMIAPLAAERDIEVIIETELPSDCTINADYTRLKQCLFNLSSNGIKYNNDGGKLIVRTEKSANNGNNIRILIEDTGNGISLERQSELFQAFNRLDAEGTNVEGTGIGLVLTKKMIELMDGFIGFSSEEGRGSIFWIELPSAGSQYLSEADTPKDDSLLALTGAGGTLLYVEDNPENIELMKMIVGEIGNLKLETALNGEDGLMAAIALNPDVIILDINLPGIDGYTLLSQLRNLVQTEDTPVLALSAAAKAADIDKAISAGFCHYLTKPIKVNETAILLKKIIEKNCK